MTEPSEEQPMSEQTKTETEAEMIPDAEECQEMHVLFSNGEPTLNGSPSSKKNGTQKYVKDADDHKKCSCFRALIASQNFVIFVIFIAMLIDSLLVTVMEPLLPDIVRHVMGGDECHLSANVTVTDANMTVAYVVNTSTNVSRLPCTFSEEESYEKYGFYIGLLSAAKPAPEIIFNLVIGQVVDRFGQRFLMVLGCFINAAVTISFGFAENYGLLIAIRVAQAFASSLTIISAMALFACSFPKEDDLARAAGIASSGLALGCIVGWPLSTFTYQFIGKMAPFLILAGLCLSDALLRLMIPAKNTSTDLTQQLKPGKFLKTLFTDRDIVVVLITVFLYCYGLSFFSALGPAWMLDKFHAELWQIGSLWGSAVFYQIIIQVTAGILAVRCAKWKFFCIGFFCYSLSFVIYPFTTVIWHGFGAEALGRVGHAFILGMSFPHFKMVTERRMTMSYGARFGVFTAVYNAGLLCGPLVGGALLKLFSFEHICWGVAVVLFLFSTVFPISRFTFEQQTDKTDVETPEQQRMKKLTGSSLIHSGTLC